MKEQLRETGEDEEEERAWLQMSARTLAQRLQEEDND
jgi:hypothetical protein